MEGLSGSGRDWVLGAEGWGLGTEEEIPDGDDPARNEQRPLTSTSSLCVSSVESPFDRACSELVAGLS